MTRQRQPHEENEKDGVRAEPLSQAAAEGPMTRFKNLTRRLLQVPREKIIEEEQRFKARKRGQK
jgi:hypothetical protein